MAKKKPQKKKRPAAKPKQIPPPRPREFLDLIAPAAVKFNTDHFILGGTYRSVMALRGYPPMTEELALLRRLGEMGGVTLHLYARQVSPAEEMCIRDRCKMCCEVDERFAQLVDACVELTPYGVQIRYPSNLELNETDMHIALRECGMIRAFTQGIFQYSEPCGSPEPEGPAPRLK